jgi:hypothetical protein
MVPPDDLSARSRSPGWRESVKQDLVYAADVRTVLQERQQKKWWIFATSRVIDAL